MRADALQNRQRLLAAATTMFCEHGLEVSVGEIADAAGVGRATVFRNFPTKDHLIAAVVSEQMKEAAAAGRELLASGDDDNELLFTMLADIVGRQQANRALLEAVSEDFMGYPDVQEGHDQLIEALTALLERGQQAGSIRPEVTAMDVLTLVKGMCMNPAAIDGANPEVTLRYMDLVRAAITTPEFSRPLRGTPAEPPHHRPPLAQRPAA